MIGKTISQYRIIEKLGQGGMGVVYRAEDVKLSRQVAIKMLPYDQGTDEDQKKRFLQEARAASALDHPNIGAIYEIDETPEGELFIAMAYYEGETLKDRIRKGQLPVNDAMQIGGQIARGMQKAHARGIIHRDLKPANIILTTEGTVKIIDFGLAKFIGGIQLTKSGISVGTVGYMSPEQICNQMGDARSDIWALGVMLYEMLTGKLPFLGVFEAALLHSITYDPPTPLATYRLEQVPKELDTLILKCLEKDPESRIQQMTELATFLAPSQSHVSGEAGSPASAKERISQPLFNSANSDRRLSPWPFSKKTLLITTVLITLLGGLCLWYFLSTTQTLSNHPPQFIEEGEGPSLAVLPFQNIGDVAQEYYADGFSRDLRHELSRIPHLLVISSVSSSLHQGPNVDLKKVSSNLGIKYLIHGTLQLLPSVVNIQISLYNIDLDKNIWLENYRVSRASIGATKEAIVKNILSKVGLRPDSASLATSTPNAEVYELYLQGIYYREQVRRESAILAVEYLTEATLKDPSYFSALINLGEAKFEIYRRGWDKTDSTLNSAEAIARRVFALDSSNTEVLALLGGIAGERGRLNEALKSLLDVIDRDRNNAFALTEAAVLYMYRLGEPAKAVRLLRKLQELDPENSLFVSNLGVSYAQLKNYHEAITAFKRAGELNPTSQMPFANLAYSYERIGRYDSAIIYYKIALEKDPAEAQVYESLCSVLFAKGQMRQADSILTHGRRILPSNQQLLYVAGVSKELLEKKSEARVLFEEGVRMMKFNIHQNPSVAENYAYLGLLYARLGNTKEAIESLNKAFTHDSTNEEVLIKTARAYAIIGLKSEMLTYFKKARTMNPEYDNSYLTTALDFEKYRSDPDLLFSAKTN